MGFPDNFEQALKNFFFKNHPRKAEKVPAIVKEFKGSEKEVMLLLCKKYDVDPNTIDGLMGYQPPVAIPEPAPIAQEKVIEEPTETAEPESEVAEENEEVAVDATEEEIQDKKED